MKKEFNIGVVLLLCLGLIIGACTKNFETINTNPNQPSSVPTTNHFGAVIVNFSGYLTPGTGAGQHANYVGSRLGVGNQSYLSVGEEWGDYYAGLTNINKIIGDAEAAGNTNMLAVALTFRAQMTQIATDNWRDMPYSEASKAEEGIIAPKYDKQEDIYKAIIADLKGCRSFQDRRHRCHWGGRCPERRRCHEVAEVLQFPEVESRSQDFQC